jgi:hypothetical protein
MATLWYRSSSLEEQVDEGWIKSLLGVGEDRGSCKKERKTKYNHCCPVKKIDTA